MTNRIPPLSGFSIDTNSDWPPMSSYHPVISSNFRHGDQSKPAETTQLTISDDRTNQHEIDQRNLSVLRHDEPEEEVAAPGVISSANADYPEQLMLLEQQNRRRVKNARSEQISMQRVAQKNQQQAPQRTRNADLKRTRSPFSGTYRSTTESPTSQSFSDSIRRSAVSNGTVRPAQMQPDTQDDRLCTKEVQALREQLSLLEAKLSQYESLGEAPRSPRFQYLYRLRQADGIDVNDDDSKGEMEHTSTVFSDPPEIVFDQNDKGHLKCSLPLRALDFFLALHQDISFVVFRDYDSEYEAEASWGGDMPQIPAPLSESIYPVASDLKGALKVFFYHVPEFQDIQNRYELTGEIFAPYHFMYHSRGELDEIKNRLPRSAKDQLDLLLVYVEENFRHEYDIVDSLLKDEKITTRYIDYLFKPGEVVVEATGEDYIGYVAGSWLYVRSSQKNTSNASRLPTSDFGMAQPTTRKPLRGRKGAHYTPQKPKSKQSPVNISKRLKTWTLNFDGTFRRSFKILTIKFPHEKLTEAVNDTEEPSSFQDISDEAQPICCLSVFPLRYAPEAVREILIRRASTFWKCRDRRLVSYHGERSGGGVDMVRRGTSRSI